MNTLPAEMRALQFDSYHENPLEAIQSLHVVSKPVPKPSHGQVLVKVAAAPCNPSDLLLLQGSYGKKKTLPAVPGWEGAGTVVATGGGLLGRWLMGKRIAFSVQGDTDGTWAQYSIVDAKTCIVLKKDVSFEQGSTMIINPLTALGLVEAASKGGHAAIIQTAAASQVGKMVLELANEQGLPTINIVRRKEQEVLLRDLGAKTVLNSESENFQKELKREAMRQNATIAFDAIAGDMTGQILNAMPNRSKVFVYGALSASSCGNLSPLGIIFQQKIVEGFYLPDWIVKKGFFGLLLATNKVQKMMACGSLHTTISAQVSLNEASKALEAYQKEMTLGKVLVCPHS
ncbi:MAG: zinc-binding dehydrogenase [Chlamydiales bacterium]|nr:zinc-binding dehydrogenase [Chlamydiales bacterium]